jgi:hypothetical protein
MIAYTFQFTLWFFHVKKHFEATCIPGICFFKKIITHSEAQVKCLSSVCVHARAELRGGKQGISPAKHFRFFYYLVFKYNK